MYWLIGAVMMRVESRSRSGWERHRGLWLVDGGGLLALLLVSHGLGQSIFSDGGLFGERGE